MFCFISSILSRVSGKYLINGATRGSLRGSILFVRHHDIGDQRLKLGIRDHKMVVGIGKKTASLTPIIHQFADNDRIANRADLVKWCRDCDPRADIVYHSPTFLVKPSSEASVMKYIYKTTTGPYYC